MVREVKRILRRGPCTLSQIAAGLSSDQELARAALLFWINRGDVVVEPGWRELQGDDEGHGCHVGCGTGCVPAGTTPRPDGYGVPYTIGVGPAVYRWVSE